MMRGTLFLTLALQLLACTSAPTVPLEPPPLMEDTTPHHADTDRDTTLDAAEEPSPRPGGTLTPRLTCAPAGDPCAELSPIEEIFASYRKDAYVSPEIYDEYTQPPLDGGRFHIAGVAATGGPVTDVLIDGMSITELVMPPTPRLEWYHVWPDPVIIGEPVWVAFHSRDPAWDSSTEGSVTVLTETGVALEGNFPVAITPAPLTYVTVTDDLSSFLIHVQNRDQRPHTVARLLINGRDVLAADMACVPERTVAPGRTALWKLELCDPAEPGEPWTVVVDWEEAPAAVGVGRVLRPHFPIEAWPSSADCVAPGANNDAYRAHLDAGFDTLYLYWGGRSGCAYETPELVNEILPQATDEMFVLIGDDFLNRASPPQDAITDTSRVAGFLTGDESDGQIYDEDGAPRPENKAAMARRLWAAYPEVSVYNGAMTSGHVGTFAGKVDVQGIDVYIAACAPYIVFPDPPRPLTAPHDFLLNTRENHMPLTTWFYAQGLHTGWNVPGADGTLHFQPNPHEILLQAMMVLTSGGKGLMWFQTIQSEARHAPERWDAIARSNWIIRSVRRLAREGDITGAAQATQSGKDGAPADVLVEAIHSPDGLLIALINTSVVEAVDDIACITAMLNNLVPHWVLDSQIVDIEFPVPDNIGLHEIFEVTTALETVETHYYLDVQERTVVIPSVSLTNELPIRLFVVAASEKLRPEIDAVLDQAEEPFLPAAKQDD